MGQLYIIESRFADGSLNTKNYENEKRLPAGYITGLTDRQIFDWFFAQKDSIIYQSGYTAFDGVRAYLKTLGLTMRKKTW